MSSGLVLTVVSLVFVAVGTDVSSSFLLLVAAPVGLLFPILFDPVSRTLWNAFELMMRPVQPGELKEQFQPNKYRRIKPNKLQYDISHARIQSLAVDYR